jgi:hypothetical protein
MEICGRQYCALMHVSQSGIVLKGTLCGTHIRLHTVRQRAQNCIGGLLGNGLVPRAGTDEVFDRFDALDPTARANSRAI